MHSCSRLNETGVFKPPSDEALRCRLCRWRARSAKSKVGVSTFANNSNYSNTFTLSEYHGEMMVVSKIIVNKKGVFLVISPSINY